MKEACKRAFFIYRKVCVLKNNNVYKEVLGGRNVRFHVWEYYQALNRRKKIARY